MTDSSFLSYSSTSPLAGITSLVPLSPVPRLIGTNKVPSDKEAEDIRAAIAAARSAISHLNAEIAHAEEGMDRLIQEREALEVYVNDHNALISPLRRVPSEIWCNIFLYCQCLPRDAELPPELMTLSTTQLTFGPRNAPGLLLRICSDWRDIALSLTRLWSRISLSSHEKFQPPLSVVETWLRRSKQGPLSVVIGSVPPTDDQTSSQFHDLVHTVLEQSHRWRVANITLPLHHVFSSLVNNLPELEELHLELNLYYAVPPGRIDSFQNAPKLRRVTFDYLPLPFASIELPLAQLTHFSHERGDRIIDLYTLLQSAPDLLEVRWGLRSDPKFDSSLTIHHSRLRNFSINAYREVGLPLDRFSLPSLRILSIEACGKFWSSPQLKCFFSLNCQTLESFELSTGDIKGSELVACLKALPSVSRLTLSPSLYRSISYRAVEELLEALCYTTSGEDPVVLPMLKLITINCEDPDKCKIGRKFVDMVETRWSILVRSNQPGLSTQESDVSRIESASLRIDSLPGHDFSMGSEDLDRLRVLRAEGLVVQISSSQPNLKSSVTHL